MGGTATAGQALALENSIRRKVVTMVGTIAFPPLAMASETQGAPSPRQAHPGNEITGPRKALPALACDCHVHVFDPARFPYAPKRSYTPGPATVTDLLCFKSILGVDRVVLVQPSVYGADNRCMVDALRKIGPARARGVAVVDLHNVSEEELDHLHANGVRSARLNLEVKGESRVDAAVEQLCAAERVLARRGWSVQLYADLPLIARLAGTMANLKIRVMLDHFAGAKVAKDPVQHYDTLRALTGTGNVFIKLSAPYRASARAPTYDDLAGIVQALVGGDAKGLVWATDWPHTGSSGARTGDLGKIEPFRKEKDGRTLDRLYDWVPDDALRKKIFVDNPGEFYGFQSG